VDAGRRIAELHRPRLGEARSTPLADRVRMSRWTWLVLSRVLALWLIVLLLAVYWLAFISADSPAGYDLHVFYVAARAVAHGHAFYDPAGLARTYALATRDLGVPVQVHAWAVYPPALYVVLVPFGYLPWGVAQVVGVVVLAVTPFLALRVMGVRDWRCYAVAYSSVPVCTSIIVGAISGALMLAVALMWRGRHVVLVGAAAIAAKLFLWPLLLVEVVHDRRRGGLLFAAATALVLVPWAFLGFHDITRYPKMLSDLSGAEGHDSFSMTGLGYALGASPKAGTDVGFALGLAVTVYALRAAHRGKRDAAYTLAIVAALLAAPIVWMHYFVLLFLPLAVRYPRLNWVWLVALVPWIGPHWGANGHIWAFLFIWPCYAIIVVAALRPELTTRASLVFTRRIGVPTTT
jgi:Glycosyltransferase family 87